MQLFVDASEIANGQQAQGPIGDLCSRIGLRGAIRLIQEFSEGFTPTRVFLAEHRASPADPQPHGLVFKAGPGCMLRDEVHRYQTFIPYARAHSSFVQMQEPAATLAWLPDDDNWGAIAYDYAAAPLAGTSCVSLKRAFKDHLLGTVSQSDIEGILETTVRALGSLYATRSADFSVAVASYYLERWSPDFEMKIECVRDVRGTPLLTLRRLNPDHFPSTPSSSADELRRVAEAPSRGPLEIVMRRIRPAEVSREAMKVLPPTAADLSMRVDIAALPDDVRQGVAAASAVSLWGHAGKSRYDACRARIADAFPGLDLDAPTVIIGGLVLHNPLLHLSRPLLDGTRPVLHTLTGPAHGDLHPGNVLIVGTTPVVIDYGLSVESAPVGVDGARLFGGLIRDAASSVLSTEELAGVLASLFGIGPPQFLDARAERAQHALARFAQRASTHLGPDAAPLWPLHLYGYGILGLKWNGSPQEAYRASFLIAAMALTQILGQPTVSVPAPAPAAAPSPAASAAPPPAPPPRPSSGLRSPAGSTELVPAATAKIIKPEGPAEILILVATFAGSADYDPTTRVYSTLSDVLFEIIPGLARVERVDEVISSRKDAVELAQTYRGSMVVWGTHDNFGVSPRYEITRESLLERRSMLQLDQATRHQLGDRFEPYITRNMATELSFLSLAAIGAICALNMNSAAAIRVFERALELIKSPEHARGLDAAHVYAHLAVLLVYTGERDKAANAIAQARALAPDNVLYELKELFVRGNAEGRSSQAWISNAKRMLQRRLEQGEGNQVGLRIALQALSAAGAAGHVFGSAATTRRGSHRRVVSGGGNTQKHKDAMVHLARAITLWSEDKYSQALASIRAALKINPRCGEAFAIKACVLANMDNLPAALEAVEKSLVFNPNLSSAYLTRAQIYCQLDMSITSAAEDVERATALGESPLDRLALWGEIMLKLGRGEDVMQFLKDFTGDPSDPDFFELRSMFYRGRGEYVLALQDADHAVATSKLGMHSKAEFPGSACEQLLAAYEERSEVYFAMGNHTAAIVDLKAAIALALSKPLWRRRFSEKLARIEAAGKQPAVKAAQAPAPKRVEL